MRVFILVSFFFFFFLVESNLFGKFVIENILYGVSNYYYLLFFFFILIIFFIIFATFIHAFEIELVNNKIKLLRDF